MKNYDECIAKRIPLNLLVVFIMNSIEKENLDKMKEDTVKVNALDIMVNDLFYFQKRYKKSLANYPLIESEIRKRLKLYHARIQSIIKFVQIPEGTLAIPLGIRLFRTIKPKDNPALIKGHIELLQLHYGQIEMRSREICELKFKDDYPDKDKRPPVRSSKHLRIYILLEIERRSINQNPKRESETNTDIVRKLIWNNVGGLLDYYRKRIEEFENYTEFKANTKDLIETIIREYGCKRSGISKKVSKLIDDYEIKLKRMSDTRHKQTRN